MVVAVSQPRVGNLPVDVTSFVGRRRELAEARGLLAAARVLTLTGPGGGGKTRLALRVAAGGWGAVAVGGWVVDLAPLQDGELLVQTVAAALGLRDHSARPPLVRLSEHLADRHLLLVLDNCEHLLEPCAVLVGKLLRSAARLWVLATSREPL